MIKILALGNSFSQDATYYLHKIAAAGGVEIKVANLFVGGCSLERHWNNIVCNAQEYAYEVNGEDTGKLVSINQALKLDDWNYVVTQQASHDSGFTETYHPYLEQIASFVREQAPQAELLLHETWAYDNGCLHNQFYRYDNDQQVMYQMLYSAYTNAAKKLNVRLIRSGDVIQALRATEPFKHGKGGMSLCRDGFHMSLIYGRYLLSAVWYKFLTGNAVLKNSYIPQTEFAPNDVCDTEVLRIIKAAVDALI